MTPWSLSSATTFMVSSTPLGKAETASLGPASALLTSSTRPPPALALSGSAWLWLPLTAAVATAAMADAELPAAVAPAGLSDASSALICCFRLSCLYLAALLLST